MDKMLKSLMPYEEWWTWFWDNDKTDEQQIGATYDELEWAMNFESSENKLTSRQREVLRIYRKFNQSNTHKMLPIPVCKIPGELI